MAKTTKKKKKQFSSKLSNCPSPYFLNNNKPPFEKTSLIIFYYKSQQYKTKVTLVHNSILFPIITIDFFLKGITKEKVIMYIKQHSNPLSLVLCGFSQKKIITASSQMFNFISKFKIGKSIAVMMNRVCKEEMLLLCEQSYLGEIGIDCEFIIVKIKNEVVYGRKMVMQKEIEFEIIGEGIKTERTNDEVSLMNDEDNKQDSVMMVECI